MNSSRILVIGLDGATFDVLTPWIESGRLPNLKRFLAEGVFGPLETIFPPVTPAAWTSFMTGKNPGKHGIFDFLYRKEKSYEFGLNNANRRDGKAVWEILSEGGKQVGVVNVPMTFPPKRINGFLVSGLGTPRNKPVHKLNYTYPLNLREEIRNRIGDYEIMPKTVYREGRIRERLNTLRKVLKGRIRLVDYLIREKSWDFFMVVFNASDLVLHDFWHLIDATHPKYQKGFEEEIGHLFYLMDDYIGRLIKYLGNKVTVVLMSDHGMGPIKKWIYINNWLMREGFLKIREAPISSVKKVLFDWGFTPFSLYTRLSKMGFSKARFGQGTRFRLINRIFLGTRNIDWSKTIAYAMGNVGQIYINLKGREPQGIIEKSEYDRVRDWIRERLSGWVDPETGSLVIQRIFFREELYQGKHLEEAPDILFMPRGLEYSAIGVSSFVYNRVFSESFGNTGNHRMEGIFVIRGEATKKGYTLKGARIIDLAPTILHLMGFPVPQDMDGRVLEGIFSRGFLEKYPVRYTSPSRPERFDHIPYTPEEEEEVKDLLRGIGYLS